MIRNGSIALVLCAFVTLGAARAELHSPTCDNNAFVPETGLWGITADQSAGIMEILRRNFGEDMLGAFVIGSRARGQKSNLKGNRPVDKNSDLDLLVQLKESSRTAPYRAMDKANEELKQLLGMQIELHTTASYKDALYKDGELITSYHGGDEAYYLIYPRESWNGVPSRGDFAIRLEP